MDNFAWADELSDRLEEDGPPRLAYLIHAVPHQHYRSEHALVEALVPEALALSRGLNIPWLDVYFKHWLCSSRVARHHGEVQLNEVVNAYEQAHQEKTQGCPQSVCLTQDLVATYANVDGPGWVPERLAACDETLARIDPSWNCFGCITIERANAMGDAGLPREAVVYLHSQREARRRAGEEPNTMLVNTEVEQWLAAGEPAKALEVLEQTESAIDADDRREIAARRLLRCQALAILGQPQAAYELLPVFDEIEVVGYISWCRAAIAIARAQPEHNTPALGQAIWTTIEHLHTVGSHRLMIQLALAQSTLALARQMPWRAEQALARAQQHLPQLREDLGAAAEVALAAQALALASAPPLPCEPAELLAWLYAPKVEGEAAQDSEPKSRSQDFSVETLIQWLEQAHQALPNDEDLASQLASALSSYKCHEQARSRLQAMVLAAPESVTLQNRWFALCLEADDMAAIEAQARRIATTLPTMSAWYSARVAFKQARYTDVGPLVEKILMHDAEAWGTRRLWADAAMELKDFSTAVAQRLEILNQTETPGPAERWPLLIAATAAQDWPQARTQARALEMELEADQTEDSPIEEDWGLVYLRYTDNDRERDILARRTGPATARILQPSPHNLPQRLGQWVVIEATLAEQPPEDEEELRHYIRVFNPPLHVLQETDYGPSYMIDGVHPGQERYEALCEALEAHGLSVWKYSHDGYRVTDKKAVGNDQNDDDRDDKSENDLPGIYLAVAAPANVTPRAISTFVAAECKGLELCWLALARAAGENTDWHEAMEERYGL